MKPYLLYLVLIGTILGFSIGFSACGGPSIAKGVPTVEVLASPLANYQCFAIRAENEQVVGGNCVRSGL